MQVANHPATLSAPVLRFPVVALLVSVFALSNPHLATAKTTPSHDAGAQAEADGLGMGYRKAPLQGRYEADRVSQEKYCEDGG